MLFLQEKLLARIDLSKSRNFWLLIILGVMVLTAINNYYFLTTIIMLFKTEIKPSFSRLATLSHSDEFAQTFCKKTLDLLDEFENIFFEALKNQNRGTLDDITHKVSSTMQWLELDGFVILIKSHKKLVLSDPKVRQKLAMDVTHYLQLIKESLREKLCSNCKE